MNLAQRLLKRVLWTLEAVQVNGSALATLAGDRGNPARRTRHALLELAQALQRGSHRAAAPPGVDEGGRTPLRVGDRHHQHVPIQCPLCHTGLGTVDRDKGFMHFDTYTRIVDQIERSCVWLSLYSWGEPFLNPQSTASSATRTRSASPPS